MRERACDVVSVLASLTTTIFATSGGTAATASATCNATLKAGMTTFTRIRCAVSPVVVLSTSAQPDA